MSALVLISLADQSSFEFQYFPNTLRTQRQVNWRPQDTTTGTKPLFYENRDPKRLSFPELWLDNTDTNESLTSTLNELEEFCTTEKDQSGNSRGAPPPLLVTWGDRKLRCVLESLDITEEYFNSDGEPTRARLSMDFIEIQEGAESAFGI